MHITLRHRFKVGLSTNIASVCRPALGTRGWVSTYDSLLYGDKCFDSSFVPVSGFQTMGAIKCPDSQALRGGSVRH